MATDFDWQTEEDSAWDETPIKDKGPPAPDLWRWLLLPAAVILLGAFLYTAYFLIGRQIKQTETAITRDVLSSHELIQRAVTTSDVELLNLLLSGRDPAWGNTQADLLAAGHFYDRKPLGIHLQAGAPVTNHVTLPADMTSAEVRSTRAFTTMGSNGLTETIILQQTAVYRPTHEDRWLLSPPGDTFWGESLTSRGRYLTLLYPARDAEIAGRLARDLDNKVAEMCRLLPDLNCPNGFRVQVYLDRNPARLAQLGQPQIIMASGRGVNLPAPSLVGLPVDEAGYQALYRGYANWVIMALIVDLVGWRIEHQGCCAQGLFHQALLEKQLSQLGLRPWPLTAAGYDRMYTNPTFLADFTHWWNEPLDPFWNVETRWAFYALVEFMLHRSPEVSPTLLQQRLIEAPNLWTWMRWPTIFRGTPPGLAQEWQDFVYERADAVAPASSTAWPEQDILLFCASSRGLFRYDPASKERYQELAGRILDAIHVLPGGDGAVLTERAGASETGHLRLILWSYGGELSLIDDPDVEHIFIHPISQDGNWLGVYTLQAMTLDSYLLNLNECDLNSCSLRTPSQFANFMAASNLQRAWSPNGQRLLMAREAFSGPGHILFWEDIEAGAGSFPERIGPGSEPFWLDNETYGYIFPGRGDAREPELAIASVKDDVPHTLLRWEDLLAAVPITAQLSELAITTITANPSNSNQLFLVATVESESRLPNMSYVFSLERATGSLTLHIQAQQAAIHHLDFSPDGRWLAVSGERLFPYSQAQPVALSYLHDVMGGRTTLSPLYSRWPVKGNWSADGRWLLRIDNEGPYLALLSEDNGSGHFRYHFLEQYNQCQWGNWINKRDSS